MKRLGSEASQRIASSTFNPHSFACYTFVTNCTAYENDYDLELSRTNKDMTEDDFDDDEAFDLSDDDDDFSEKSITPSMVMTPNAAALANLFSKGKKEKVSITKAYSMALGAVLPAILTEQVFCVDFLKTSADVGLGSQKSPLDKYLENMFSDLMPELTKLINRCFKWDQLYAC